MIKVNNLIKSFKSGDGSELVVLKGLSLEVSTGEFLSITGRSGSGKSTLLYQLGLLDYPNSGEIFINNVDILKLNNRQRTQFRLEKLGYVFQDYALLPELSALENVMLPLLMQGYRMSGAKEKAASALDKMGLSDKLNNLPSQLSGGQQQRVSIARAIGHDPDIIFADEPTANLDSETADNVMNAFLQLHSEGQTIVMVSHEEEYCRRTDRTLTLSDGVIIEDIKH
jgi:putative ABC transport system ATP-binding protein